MRTGPTNDTRLACWERDGGVCVRCGRTEYRMQLHHRRPRGAGGSSLPDTNQPQNLIWLCEPCHSWTESNRVEARALGLLVLQGHDPAAKPVRGHLGAVLLTADARAVPYLPDERPLEAS